MAVKTEPQSNSETYYAGAYWGSRKESPEECARRAVVFLNSLAACDPLLAHWNKIPKPRARPWTQDPLMPPELPVLTEAFRKGVNREPGGPPIEHLGLTVAAYNDGARETFASLSMCCGSYAEGRSSNVCVLDLPSNGPDADRILTAPVLSAAVRSMAVAWEPDWAVAMSHAHRDMDDEEGKADVWVGWVTYLARHQGTLIILTPERFTVTNPEHVSLARRVRELLARAGLLRPA